MLLFSSRGSSYFIIQVLKLLSEKIEPLNKIYENYYQNKYNQYSDKNTKQRI